MTRRIRKRPWNTSLDASPSPGNRSNKRLRNDGFALSVAAFLESIRHPKVKKVAAHWAEARAGKRAPSWRDIDPTAIGPCLPMVWSWRWDEADRQFIGRLAGAHSTAVINKSMRGRSLSEVFGPSLGQETHDLYFRVMTEPALFHATGKIYGMFGGVGIGERVILPLGEDGRSDGVLGATWYSLRDEDGQEEIKSELETKQRTFVSLTREI
jgi:hypothetical protein